MSTKKRSVSDDGRSDTASDAKSYPRKRVSIACEVCRLRKTRCDAAKPACSFCAELGIECVYKRPADASRADSRSEELNHALQRLDKIEATLDSIARKIGVHDQQPRLPEPSPFVGTPLALRNEPVTPSPTSVSTSSKPRKLHTACKMPTLLTFKHPMSEHNDWSYNCTEYFFNDQMDTIADMRQHVNLPHSEPDFSEPHLWNLHRSFADNVLKWLPLFDPDTAAQHLQYARSTEYRHTNPSLCVVYLIFANGAIALDTSLYSRSAHELPGFRYYARALAILDRLPTSGKDLTALQCRVLVTIYLLFAMRPLEAWKNITQASQECILSLRANAGHEYGINESPAYREAFKRVYWICYVLENELEACLEVPSSGICLFEAQVPLPISHYEEEGMYFLLALSSLRKVMVEVLDTVGYKSTTGFVAYNPVVALELRTQIDEWYRHLPAPLRFQSDSNILFDTRRAYLRCSYYALVAVATWPFVIPLAQSPLETNTNIQQNINELQRRQSGPNSHPSQESIPTLQNHRSNGGTSMSPPNPLTNSTSNNEVSTPSSDPNHQAAAQACLSACRTYLSYAEEILTSKSLTSHLIVRQYFAFTMILILVFQGVDLQDGGESMEERRRLEGAMRNLHYWDCVPFMGESLGSMRRIAGTKGLGLGLGR